MTILRLLLTIATFSISSAFFTSSWANGLGLDSINGNDDDFLPVEEAYQASITVEDDHLLIDWVIAPEYYLYKDKFKLSSSTPEETTLLKAVYDSGIIKYDEYYAKEVESFYTTTQIKIPLTKLSNEFELKMRSQGCADAGLCYPPQSQYFQVNLTQKTILETPKSLLSVKVAPNALPNTQSHSPSQQGPTKGAPFGQSVQADIAKPSLALFLLMAMGGGLLLNLMPCVFPVLSLKALSFASTSGSNHSHHLHGWAYTLGVIGSFVIVALIILTAKAAGEQTGWGFQLQAPEFVASMTYLFLVMGLSLSGMIHFGTSLMGIGHGLTAQEGLRGSFFTGILAAVVASPCTGPLMAPALGFALSQPALISLLVFIALGFGMALPFLLLSYSPKLAALLPRPGVWMEKLKELLAFPMYLTAAWLVFVFGRQVGMGGVFFLLLGAIAIVFAIWLFKHQPKQTNLRLLVRASGVIALLFASYIALTSESFRNQQDDSWQEYSQERVEALRKQGHPVLVDFTADWCITCKANEAIALSGEAFQEIVKEHNVALVKGDWTNEDERISKVLKAFKRSGVPLYLMYPADISLPPEVLPQLLTKNTVIEAIERAALD